MSEELVTEHHGTTLVIRLNRPEVRNALNHALMEQIGRAVLDADGDPGVRAVILTGTGDRAFCAGMDLKEFATGGQSAADQVGMDGFRKLFDGQVSTPLIGAANASALAGGFELLMTCDLIVASSEARFGLPEVKRGLIPGGNGTLLADRIPLSMALEMLLTGDTIDAERAHALGLLNVVVTPDEVLTAALALASRIAVNGPLAVAATKELVHLGVKDRVRARQRLGELTTLIFASDDAKEGSTAFLEKRPPVWQGR